MAQPRDQFSVVGTALTWTTVEAGHGRETGTQPICFTPGTQIATPAGARAVETLRPGDAVITRDNGIRRICWKGTRGLTGVELFAAPHLRPVLIRAGALGGGLPITDMRLSPGHRALVSNDKTLHHFDEREVLVAARDLLGRPGVEIAPVPWTTYIHIMFEQHEIILSNGTWTESFEPGDESLGGVGALQRCELEHLFPDLKTSRGRASYQTARRALTRTEAELLLDP
ncbi:Hint domain-containing protein [uncultured Roseobacter sp.]|uniref:Hint domain-containing protein n=1 Tax=uncultured Roseobacter sp. TaxID=114847 RepID=UPI00260C8ACC|nr:Hint domain-containing protein [uncultured Roseobacter sp.]